MDREKSIHVNRFTLNFREKEKEKSYHQDFDFGFIMSMGCSLLLLILAAGLQVSALPRTLILLLLFLTAFVWISAILMLVLAARLKWIYWDLAQSFSLRLAITVFTIILLYSVGQVNVVSDLNQFQFEFRVIFSISPIFSSLVSRIIHAKVILQQNRKTPMTCTVTGNVHCHNTFHCLLHSHLSQFQYF